MRLRLVACTAHKHEPEQNIAAHLACLAEAEAEGCDLVVLPEFSLTGSIDPTRAPEELLTLEDDEVERLVAATRGIGAGVVFGIGERNPDGDFITQVFARSGAIVGVQRKRHLGEDEAGWDVATGDELFEFGPTRFAIVICAESAHDEPWRSAVAAGAEIVLLCAAPGLYGRRTSDATWRDGLQWWESAGLADARRQAARHGLWVALATQAGQTHDEDFPGLAALVDPSGAVVARLPDWRAGTLVVDVPLDGVDPLVGMTHPFAG